MVWEFAFYGNEVLPTIDKVFRQVDLEGSMTSTTEVFLNSNSPNLTSKVSQNIAHNLESWSKGIPRKIKGHFKAIFRGLFLTVSVF